MEGKVVYTEEEMNISCRQKRFSSNISKSDKNRGFLELIIHGNYTASANMFLLSSKINIL